METFLSVLYVLVCLSLIGVVLLQSGKGGGLGGIGGGASQQMFGGAGAGNVLTRITAGLAFAFMGLSMFLSVISSSGDRALDRAAENEASATNAAAVAEENSEAVPILDEPSEAPDEDPSPLAP